jgi:hypothetical protein
LDQAAAALLGAAIGAFSGFGGSYLTAVRQSHLERERWQRARDDVVRADTRRAMEQLTRDMAALSHSMMWATYKALEGRSVPASAVTAYEAELHRYIADMVSAQTLVSAVDRQLYERVTPGVSKLIRADLHDAAWRGTEPERLQPAMATGS